MTDTLYRFGFLLLVFGGLLALNADGFGGSASGAWTFGMVTMLLGGILAGLSLLPSSEPV